MSWGVWIVPIGAAATAALAWWVERGPLSLVVPPHYVVVPTAIAASFALALCVRGQHDRWLAMAGWVLGAGIVAFVLGDFALYSERRVFTHSRLVPVMDVGLVVLAASTIVDRGEHNARPIPAIARLFVVYGAQHTAFWLIVGVVVAAADLLRPVIPFLFLGLLAVALPTAAAAATAGGPLGPRGQAICGLLAGPAFVPALPLELWSILLERDGPFRAIALVPFVLSAVGLLAVWLRVQIHRHRIDRAAPADPA